MKFINDTEAAECILPSPPPVSPQSFPRHISAWIGVLALVLGAFVTTTSFAHANCGVGFSCGADGTVTSAIEVKHAEDGGGSDDVVSPDDGETWAITATWSTTVNGLQGMWCVCDDVETKSVDAEVQWTGSAWSVTCTGCDSMNGPIYSVSICDTGSCSKSGSTHGYSYKLLVDIDHTRSVGCGNFTIPTHLTQVDYSAKNVDNGDDLENCVEFASLSPKATNFEASDTGTYECDFDCNATGPSVTILYE